MVRQSRQRDLFVRVSSGNLPAAIERTLSLDLLTPARQWAWQKPDDLSTPHKRMPMPQRIVMLISVVGPIAGVIAAIYMLWGGGWDGIAWPQAVAMIVMYLIAGYGVTIGFHRLLTHKAFETQGAIRILFAIFGSMRAQGAVIRWCATHRRHHQTSDRNGDPHSPHLHGDDMLGFLRGMYHAHVGWCFKPDPDEMARSVPDLIADRAILWVDQLYFLWVFL